VWETALAFAVWGGYGSVLASAHIDPALTAVARTVGLGVVLALASVIIGRFVGPRDITMPIPWRNGTLWLSGALILVDEVLYSVSAVSGPVAIIGLAYGCVPILVPLLSRLTGADTRAPMRAHHWICLVLAFAGNALILLELDAARIRFTLAAVFALFAALLFTAIPICTAKLQQAGMGSWAVLMGQGAAASILTIPLLALLIALGFVGTATTYASDVFRRSVEVGAINAVAFTIVPFSLWYRGIARCGVARTSICAFAEPLVATLCSLFVLKDAPATPLLVTGVALVLAGIAASMRFND
jgi:drug/metabolite transporter (DMT)-like permease